MEYVIVQPNKYNNPYINDVSYPKATSEAMKMVQLNHAYQSLMTIGLTKFMDPGDQIYVKTMKYLDDHQYEYNITVNELNKKMKKILLAIGKAMDDNNHLGSVDERILKRGFCELSDKFFEDVCSLKFSVSMYIGAINQIAEHLEWLA